MASIAEGSDGRGAPIHGVEITSQKIVSPYRLYFKHALGTALPVTFSYSLSTFAELCTHTITHTHIHAATPARFFV